MPLFLPVPISNVLAGYAKNIDLNAVADTIITLVLPPGVTMYRLSISLLYNHGTTASLTTARAGLFSAAAGGGTAILADQVLSGLTSNALNTNGALLGMANTLSTAAINFNPVYFRVGTAQGAAASGDFYFYVFPVP